MPHHAKAAGWTAEHSRRWFARCDKCSTRRIVADYYEVYPPIDSEGDESGWWWECSCCLLDTISGLLEDSLQKLESIDLLPCRRVSICCATSAAPTNSGIMLASLCSSCWRIAGFMCSQHAGTWPDPEGECLKQENLDGA